MRAYFWVVGLYLIDGIFSSGGCNTTIIVKEGRVIKSLESR